MPQPTVLIDGLRCRLDDVLAVAGAEIGLVDGDRVRLTTAETEMVVASPELAAWLRAAGARSVVVRPDRIVRSAS